MQAKLKHMWWRKVDHIIIIASSDSTIASREMAANSALIIQPSFISFNFPLIVVEKLLGLNIASFINKGF